LLELNGLQADLELLLREFTARQTEENERRLLELQRAMEARREAIRECEHDLDLRAEEIRTRQERTTRKAA
jgi:hypothetical protein